MISAPNGNSSLDSIKVLEPSILTPNFPAFGNADDKCPGLNFGDAFDPAVCPSQSLVGEMAITSPLLPDPIYGQVYLIASDPLPWFGVAIDDPATGISIRLVGQTSTPQVDPTCISSQRFCQTQIAVDFGSIPDLPVSSVDFSVDGAGRTGSTGQALGSGRQARRQGQRDLQAERSGLGFDQAAEFEHAGSPRNRPDDHRLLTHRDSPPAGPRQCGSAGAASQSQPPLKAIILVINCFYCRIPLALNPRSLRVNQPIVITQGGWSRRRTKQTTLRRTLGCPWWVSRWHATHAWGKYMFDVGFDDAARAAIRVGRQRLLLALAIAILALLAAASFGAAGANAAFSVTDWKVTPSNPQAGQHSNVNLKISADPVAGDQTSDDLKSASSTFRRDCWSILRRSRRHARQLSSAVTHALPHHRSARSPCSTASPARL